MGRRWWVAIAAKARRFDELYPQRQAADRHSALARGR
jgi:hypothetical protein